MFINLLQFVVRSLIYDFLLIFNPFSFSKASWKQEGPNISSIGLVYTFSNHINCFFFWSGEGFGAI